ncbi:uncharacterized protein LOC116346116 [Contarinia nasturtii]|uniref:uncharacterized protein LOC116346116 n=1 Tax=Contarinia nasturtii TaxID=265458 RepID=UPI0012D41046|nr:uncharacterized protein LOC116346116 [Contarinia nasturtii]
MDEYTSDVNFVFKSQDGGFDKLPAHKNLLIASSDVFRVMFDGRWKETDSVQIDDASVDSFQEFLRFFYFDEVKLTMANIEVVIDLGKRYEMSGCVSACARFLEYNMTTENVCFVYELAILYGLTKLQRICEMTIAIDSEATFKSSFFLDCHLEVLRRIVNLKMLSCSETVVFKACMEWVRAVSNEKTVTKTLVEKHLGKLFYDIRFASMSIIEFGPIFLRNRSLFPIEEHQDILLAIMSKEHKPKFFNGKNRLDACDLTRPKVGCIREYDDATEMEHKIGEPISTTFHVNATLLLRGIICAEMFRLENWPIAMTKDLTGRLTIIEIRGRNSNGMSSIVYVDEQIILKAKQDNCIELNKPIIIRRGIKYKIQLDLNLPFTSCSLIYFKSAEMNIEKGTCLKFSGDTMKNKKRRGIVYGLQFTRF